MPTVNPPRRTATLRRKAVNTPGTTLTPSTVWHGPVVEPELLELLEQPHVGEDVTAVRVPGEAHGLDQADLRVIEPARRVVRATTRR